jgi:hypothetical protein
MKFDPAKPEHWKNIVITVGYFYEKVLIEQNTRLNGKILWKIAKRIK